MNTGRKILNLRCDRKISQQDLARCCDITPSALSKIEAGINSPRANILWRIAQNLGVTVEYLLDERIPYPYAAYNYRQELRDRDLDPESTVRREVSREEGSYLDALRKTHPVTREVCFALPEASVETIRLVHFILSHSRIQNPGPAFWAQLKTLVATDTVGVSTGVSANSSTNAKKSGGRKKSSPKPKPTGGRVASRARPTTRRRKSRR